MIRKTSAVPAPSRDRTLVQMAPAAIAWSSQSVSVDGSWRRVYTLAAFPPIVEAGWLTHVANLPGVTLSLQARPQEAGTLITALNRRIGGLNGQLATGSNDPITAQRLTQERDDALTLMQQMDADQQEVFQCGVFLTVSAPDPDTGLRRAKRLEGQLAAHGMRARVLAYRQEDGLLAAGPWGLWPNTLPSNHLWPASTVAAAWPFGGGGIHHGSGMVLGHDATGGLVMINCWDPPAESGITNKNFVILAPPGAGKSHAVKVIGLREWGLGAKLFVIDPEGEYEPLARAVGGTVINAAGSHTRINPLQAPFPRVLAFFATYLPHLTPLQQARLDSAVEAVYRAKHIAWDAPADLLASINADAWPHVGDVYQYCRHQTGEDWDVLSALLRTTGDGVLADLWSGPSTVPTPQDADCVVVDIHDLQDMPDPIKRAQYVNVLGWLTDAVLKTRRDEKKILVVDEAWMLIDPQAPQALHFMKSVSKRIRKYGGSFMVVTQNVADFLAPAVAGEGEQVLTNAAYTLLLRQGGKDLHALTTLFDLSEAEQDKLTNARVGEGLLIAGNDRAWVTVDTAPHESALLYGS